jgi:hypothetical protein
MDARELIDLGDVLVETKGNTETQHADTGNSHNV